MPVTERDFLGSRTVHMVDWGQATIASTASNARFAGWTLAIQIGNQIRITLGTVVNGLDKSACSRPPE